MELKDMITRLGQIKEERKRLEQEEKLYSTPFIADTERVKAVYDYCAEAYVQLAPQSQLDTPFVRRRILFVILFLFSPKTLAGGKMTHGLRAKIAAAMNMEPSNVSHYHTNILFYYKVYKDFRDDVNNIFKDVYEKLKK